jgi:hypothetical protein
MDDEEQPGVEVEIHYFSPRIPVELLKRVRAEAARRHMQMEDVAEEALTRWLEWSMGAGATSGE